MEKKKLFLTVGWQRVNTEDGLDYELAIGKHSNERGCSAGPMGEPCQHSAPQGLPQVQVSVQREPQLYQVTLGKQPFTKWSMPHQQLCLPIWGPEVAAPFLAFLPKGIPKSTPEETIDNPKLKAILHSPWPVLFRSVKRSK